MYRIECDGLVLYHPLLRDYQITEGELSLEMNTAGTLSFVMPSSNPHLEYVKLMKSTICLYDDDRLVFRGRPYSPGRDLYGNNKIVCEGELAFLNDSIQEPMDYTGSISGLFSKLIEVHNGQVDEERQFDEGKVVILPEKNQEEIVYSEKEYKSTWDILKEIFIEGNLGGYIWIRHEESRNYIDYIQDVSVLGEQKIEQCVNLIEATEEMKCDNLTTAVIPIGAKTVDKDGNQTDEFTTIEEVNNGKKYIINQEGVKAYGWIFKAVEFEDIADKEQLKKAVEKYLAQASSVTDSIEISAADLSKAGYEVKPFSFGTYINVKIQNLDVDKNMLIKSLSVNLLAPGEGTIKVGDSIKTFTGNSIFTSQSIGRIENNIDSGFRQNQIQINEMMKDTMSKIEQSEDKIMSQVSDSYYLKADANELQQSMETRFEQTADEFEFMFSGMRKDIDDLLEGSSAEFDSWKKYIRFKDGNIILGEDGNEIELVIENDRLSFRQNNAEVAYLSNAKLTVTDGEFLNTLRIGNFVFSPRANGNLSFKKVG